MRYRNVLCGRPRGQPIDFNSGTECRGSASLDCEALANRTVFLDKYISAQAQSSLKCLFCYRLLATSRTRSDLPPYIAVQSGTKLSSRDTIMNSKQVVFPLAVGVPFGMLRLRRTSVAARSDRGPRTCALRRKLGEKNREVRTRLFC